jgi:uncharacterized protein (TIGR02145 family)
LLIYPNPMSEKCFIEFEAASSGNVIIELFDVAGKPVIHTLIMLQGGRHTFSVSGLNGGMYTLSIRSAAYVYSGKIACTRIGSGNPKINYVSTHLISTSQSKLKSLQSVVPMQYNNGDQLLFTCFSGIYSTVIPLVPVQSQTVTANFIACTDADNNNYATVTIGSQVWMAENLNVGVRIAGNQEQTDNGIKEKYCYNDLESNCNIYGGLYQWNEMMQYVTTEGAQGICPTGWHLPSDGEWTTVTDFLGDVFVAGGKMKTTGTIEAGTGLWYDPNTGATNESGFTALPAGARYLFGAFNNVGYYGTWWSSSEDDASTAWIRGMYYGHSTVYSYNYDKNSVGFSVRCLRDESIPFTCGTSIIINHVAGDVAPVDKTVTYGTVTNIPGEPTKCWITSNLGADHQATAVDDATEASAGWYWQFNRKQGFQHTGTIRTPNTTWISSISENSDWTIANDPCTLELGSGWRIPTNTEWYNVDNTGGWTDWNGPWNSDLKLHAAGLLDYRNGFLFYRGSLGSYWSSTGEGATIGWNLGFNDGYSSILPNDKAYGYSVRCLRE